ncbi:hypothetical protein M0804_009677 [Polistes exclamans]|nr:hypothetical protein M0804_009677 [Polistes exclamans]
MNDKKSNKTSRHLSTSKEFANGPSMGIDRDRVKSETSMESWNKKCLLASCSDVLASAREMLIDKVDDRANVCEYSTWKLI